MAEPTTSLAPLALDTLVDLLQQQAARLQDTPAFIFCPEGDTEEARITYRELDSRARSIAVDLQRQGAAGERVLVLCRPGVDSVAGLFGCFYAGAVAVPVDEHWPIRRIETVVPEADARFALATAKTQAKMKAAVDGLSAGPKLSWLAMDEVEDDGPDWELQGIGADSLAMIQYTSGSTGIPKGCVLTHRNYVSNLEIMRWALNPPDDAPVLNSPISGVSWLPQYHDMGFVGGILGTIYGGRTTVLMSPSAFLMRPIRWLQAISRFQATITAAPNFAYEACVKRSTPEQRAALDLSSLSIAVVGAGPISSETLRSFTETFAPAGFRAEAFIPAYGLAEATLGVTGMSDSPVPVVRHFDRTSLGEDRVVEVPDDSGGSARLDEGEAKLGPPHDPAGALSLVACGAKAETQEVLIVDPETRVRRGDDEVGEIWVAGPSVGVGYWGRPEETEYAFDAHLADTGEGPYLRSGDLGFFRDGELYVTGRCKDLMTIGGYSHYPNDIELTVQDCHPALMPGRGAVFQLPTERYAPEYLVVVQEVHHHEAAGVDLDGLIESIRAAIRAHHGVDAQAVVLLKPMRIPTTTSGKIQRGACRDQYVAGELVALAQWAEPRPENKAQGVKGALMAGLGRLVAANLGQRVEGSDQPGRS
ncbi:fatty acyl-AMP ligase [Mycolicibacter algericus]|uniref:Acyl-CoA synthetase n=2 Tax=Mycolicibacter algericus TaxID=1288388 RepID=A0A7I9YEK4_MYCAL|nr:fatty acyl-AMP ligase [Mycolicibacter algericus]OQZ96283.1 fatty-acid--CoA ligase [Mycolicibacter algericus DSM 45454]GFG87076.1 acyl-CoA synthetase [Mycolicibacter algericus]